MEFRTLGQTGMQVSTLSYGASALGGAFGDIDESEGIRTVHAALDLGINYLDVAPYYGLTRAETVLGRALQSIRRDRYFLSTKVGRYGDNAFDFSAARVKQSVRESLARLQLDYVDIILCHDIEFGDLQQIIHETLPALREIVQSGQARFVGISGLPLKIFREVLEQSEVDVILSYCRHSLNDTSLQSLLPFLAQKQVGVINASPLSMGLLSGQKLPAWHPAPPEIRAACQDAADFCTRNGSDIVPLALQFATRNPNIATTLVGAASVQNIEKNVRCLDEPLNSELLGKVQQILAPIQNQSWPSGRAENND